MILFPFFINSVCFKKYLISPETERNNYKLLIIQYEILMQNTQTKTVHISVHITKTKNLKIHDNYITLYTFGRRLTLPHPLYENQTKYLVSSLNLMYRGLHCYATLLGSQMTWNYVTWLSHTVLHT